MNDEEKIKNIIEGLLLAAAKPLKLERIENIFTDDERPSRDLIKAALDKISEECEGRGFELQKVASGYRLQVRQELSEWVGRLWDEKPQRYSRALLETLSIIAYRQPITRGDIEKIRGVAVSSNIVRTLLEREWARVVGHRDVPGRPAMYATTRQFLDYFNLETLEQLPALTEIRDMDEINQKLSLEEEAKPVSRVIEFPDMEEEEEVVVMDEEEEAAAAIGTRPINEILGIKPVEDEDEDFLEEDEEAAESSAEDSIEGSADDSASAEESESPEDVDSGEDEGSDETDEGELTQQ